MINYQLNNKIQILSNETIIQKQQTEQLQVLNNQLRSIVSI